MASNLEERLKQQRKHHSRYTVIVAGILLVFAVLAGALSFWWFGGRLNRRGQR
jgi:flagellar basal body-associated protein FliL